MDTCVAIIMYCQMLFLLFTGNEYCLHKNIFGGPTCNEYLSFMQNFKFVNVTVLAVQLFNKIKRNEKENKKKKTKNMKKHVSLYFRMLCRNTFIFGEFILFCMF